MKTAINLFTNLLKDESGQDLIEYALVAGLIGLGAVATMGTLSTSIGTALGNIGTRLTAATPAS
jgi:pilus assembly protein Flp/PilA